MSSAHFCNTDGTIKNNLNVDIFEGTLMAYFVIHVFLNSIPNAGDQLEGVPLTKEMEVSHAALRKVKDIEGLVWDVHTTGPLALKRMQIRNGALPPFILASAFIRLMMILDDGFANFIFVINLMIASLFILTFAKQVIVVVVINSKSRDNLHNDIEALMKMENGLNFLLEHINTALMIEEAPWRTVELICNDLSKLNVTARAILVDAIQKRGVNRNAAAELLIKRLFLESKGEMLVQLKNMTDLGGDYQNLYKLIYSDISSEHTRNDILEHFKSEAGMMARSANEKHGIPLHEYKYGVKILSDVDDTLYSSGGKFPAGIDKEYPKHQLYPGCLNFFRSLDKIYDVTDSQGVGVEGTPSDVDESECNLVFLSARPHAYKDMAEEHSYRLFKGLVREGKMHVIPTLLPGRLKQGLQAVLLYPFKKTLAWKAVGELKFKTFENYSKMYPEYKYVFCGDDGQGDLLAGELMSKHYPGSVLAVFIHRVVEKGKALHTQVLESRGETLLGESLKSPDRSASWNELSETIWPGSNIYVTETYIKSAAIACTLGLITTTELFECAASAIDEFDEIRCMYPDRGADWSEAEKDLDYDIVDANEVLKSMGWEGEVIGAITKTTVLFDGKGEEEGGGGGRVRRISLSSSTKDGLGGGTKRNRTSLKEVSSTKATGNFDNII